mgnify:CR=1 FL=1
MDEQAGSGIYGQRPLLFLFGAGVILVATLDLSVWLFLKIAPRWGDPWGLAAPLLAQWLLDPDRRPAQVALALGLPLGMVLLYAFPGISTFTEPIALGITSSAVSLGLLLIRPSRRSRTAAIFAAGMLVILGEQICNAGQALTAGDALTFDHRAYLIDLSLGISPVGVLRGSFDALPEFLRRGGWVGFQIIYETIMLMMAVVVLLHLRVRSPRWAVALAALLLSGGIGGLLYHFFPAAGPAFAFPGFPALPPTSAVSPAAAPLDVAYARNCMPSLHTTWALLIALNARGLARSFRCFAALYLVATVLATLIFGQHYLIDLVVAVPFALAMQSLAEAMIARRLPTVVFWAGSAAVAGWFLVLIWRAQWFLAIPGFTLAACVATLAGGILGVSCLRRPARHWRRRPPSTI